MAYTLFAFKLMADQHNLLLVLEDLASGLVAVLGLSRLYLSPCGLSDFQTDRQRHRLPPLNFRPYGLALAWFRASLFLVYRQSSCALAAGLTRCIDVESVRAISAGSDPGQAWCMLFNSLLSS